MGFVDNIQSGVLGSLGLAFLIYTVLSTIQKVEESLNFVWRVERPRSWARRISEYLSLMVIGPILTVAAFGLTACLTNTTFVRWLTKYEPFGTAMYVAGQGRTLRPGYRAVRIHLLLHTQHEGTHGAGAGRRAHRGYFVGTRRGRIRRVRSLRLQPHSGVRGIRDFLDRAHLDLCSRG